MGISVPMLQVFFAGFHPTPIILKLMNYLKTDNNCMTQSMSVIIAKSKGRLHSGYVTIENVIICLFQENSLKIEK